MALADVFRRLLDTLDVVGARAFWREHAPHLPQPETDAAALAAMHMARTSAESMPLKARAYSHAWLLDRGAKSLLPDHLKASAEQICPRTVAAVGISVNFRVPELQPAGALIRGAMEGAVLEAEANGRLEDAAFVSARMAAARDRERKALFGRWF